MFSLHTHFINLIKVTLCYRIRPEMVKVPRIRGSDPDPDPDPPKYGWDPLMCRRLFFWSRIHSYGAVSRIFQADPTAVDWLKLKNTYHLDPTAVDGLGFRFINLLNYKTYRPGYPTELITSSSLVFCFIWRV